MSRIFWDTNLFVYWFERRDENYQRVVRLRERMLARGDELMTSSLAIGELLVKPRKLGRNDLCLQYEESIRGSARIVPFDLEAARAFATIRAGDQKSIRIADAIQMACAATVSTDLFVTNDRDLQGLQVDGIQFISALDRVPL